MARQANGGLSYVEGKGYRVTVGKTLGSDGVARYRTWWLGHDRVAAAYAAEELKKLWEYARKNFTYWRPRDLDLAHRLQESFNQSRRVFIDRMERYGGSATEPPPSPAPTAVEKPSTPTVMLHPALDAYVQTMQAKTTLSEPYRRRIRETVDDLKEFRRNMPLQQVDRLWLETLTDSIKGRPLSRKKDRVTGKREPIKPATVKTLLQHWRMAFDWLDRQSETDRFGRWESPKRMNELFSCDLNSIRTKTERDRAADGPEQLTLAEIKALIDAASDRQRMFILMGLFCGTGQTELRWTRRDEFDLEKATFTHRRNKTGQLGRFWLPPELVDLLRKYFAKVEPLADGSAFSTREGQPLVTGTSDSIRQTFEDVRLAAKLSRSGISFYALRRFLADRAKRKGGAELRDAALAHAARSIGDRHYSNFRDFSAVAKLAREMHREMKTAGVFDYAQKKRSAPA